MKSRRHCLNVAASHLPLQCTEVRRDAVVEDATHSADGDLVRIRLARRALLRLPVDAAMPRCARVGLKALDPDVALLPPALAPRVADFPEFAVLGVLAESDSDDGVVDDGVSLAVAEDPAAIHAPSLCVGRYCHWAFE